MMTGQFQVEICLFNKFVCTLMSVVGGYFNKPCLIIVASAADSCFVAGLFAAGS